MSDNTPTLRVNGSVAPTNDEEQERIILTHGGGKRFFLFTIEEPNENNEVAVQMYVTGLNPDTLPALLRDMATGMEQNNG
jgi:hypothetical protein